MLVLKVVNWRNKSTGRRKRTTNQLAANPRFSRQLVGWRSVALGPSTDVGWKLVFFFLFETLMKCPNLNVSFRPVLNLFRSFSSWQA